MINHETHDEADFDSIIGDGEDRAISTNLDLLPSSWGLPFGEQKRILKSGLTLKISTELPERNWPACADRDEKSVRIAQDFLDAVGFSREEKLATIVHEIGHIVNPEPAEKHWTEKSEVERTAGYLVAMNPDEAPAALTELYADDYARYCELGSALESALEDLKATSERFRKRATDERINRLKCAESLLLAFEDH